ncbi:metalloregulator ArsR/SmtB family transcription factor [Thermaerobacter composti]|uniref:Metalloregulator ArsR/SmtB family transcription factor n=1 Tax=Thermaerobacter composti TaxID=554949 RepID=A0ABZ0QLX9_9FIRM|nr:metalloregulator ArsR/SmtB family transcription factor [Thermaerobacter composti]WPD18494.1 metalloregulator ArsR/SmtB family transcription factor [Thermaerobacter composti]
MDLDRAFAALADPTRRHIVTVLRSAPQDVDTLARPLPISRPAVSKHLAVLAAAGLVEVEKSGRRRLYRLHPEGFAEVRRWLDQVARTWDVALERFRRHVEGDGEG